MKADLPRNIEPTVRVVPYSKAEKDIDDVPHKKFHGTYTHSAHDPSEKAVYIRTFCSNEAYETQTDPTGQRHGPVGVAPVNEFDCGIKNCPYGKHRRVKILFFQK